MCLMGWHMWRTRQMVREPAPNPVLPPHAAEATA
jgi:hypothetical protein